jgi:DNA processing protein
MMRLLEAWRDSLKDAGLDLLMLSLVPGLHPRAIAGLRKAGIVADAIRNPMDFQEFLREESARHILSGKPRAWAECELREASRRGLRIVSLDDQEYPSLLQHTSDPPPVLYVSGPSLCSLAGEALAIVGSRKASPQGLATARSLARELAGAGLTIVSGLARGIDTEAHRGALEARGTTIAILGSGLSQVYPPENAELAAEIAERGAVVSEFPLSTPPYPQNFPRRNRVIAGWVRGVIVVEAGEKSGALGTARLALEGGRDVFAVPGHPSHPGAVGTNRLIRDGAILTRHAGDVAQEWSMTLSAPAETCDMDDSLLKMLRSDAPSSVDDLQVQCGRPVDELLAHLTNLELAQKVRRLPGSLYLRN